MNLRNVISAAVLAVCSSFAQASGPAPTQWEFTWQGFYVYPGGFSGYDDPGYIFTGTFSGVDGNSDGVLALDELTELTLDGYNYAACPAETPTFDCNISSFSYSAAGGLNFRAYKVSYTAPPGTGGWMGFDDVYEANYRISHGTFGEQMPLEETALEFRPFTRTTITQISPVPEPATFAMLGAGLILIGASRLRRK